MGKVPEATQASRLRREWRELCAPTRIAPLEQHMLDMSWEEHELKMELIRAQARQEKYIVAPDNILSS